MIETKDIVYYVIQALGILVTGIFSYLVVRFTRQSAKAAVESAKALTVSVKLSQQLAGMQEKKGKDIALRFAYLLTGEVKHNRRIYKQTDEHGHSLQKLLESDGSPVSYAYDRSSHPIKMLEWDDHKKQIIELDPLLGDQLGRVYKRFELLLRHNNVDQLDVDEFKDFSHHIELLLRKIALEKA
jgi:hypothetical protein